MNSKRSFDLIGMGSGLGAGIFMSSPDGYNIKESLRNIWLNHLLRLRQEWRSNVEKSEKGLKLESELEEVQPCSSRYDSGLSAWEAPTVSEKMVNSWGPHQTYWYTLWEWGPWICIVINLCGDSHTLKLKKRAEDENQAYQ